MHALDSVTIIGSAEVVGAVRQHFGARVQIELDANSERSSQFTVLLARRCIKDDLGLEQVLDLMPANEHIVTGCLVDGTYYGTEFGAIRPCQGAHADVEVMDELGKTMLRIFRVSNHKSPKLDT